jgi:hypothetical protein
MIGCPKLFRETNVELIREIMDEQGVCLIGWLNKHGSCYGGHDPHHITSRGSGGGDIRGNIIRLCRKHHDLAHRGKIKKSELYEALEIYGQY